MHTEQLEATEDLLSAWCNIFVKTLKYHYIKQNVA